MIAATGQFNAQQWLTPPQIASERGIRTSKVLAWIATGQLAAVNHATRRSGRPRWRISRAALDAFDAARSSRLRQGTVTSRRRRQADPSVVKFF